MILDRRTFLASAAASALPAQLHAQSRPVFRPEDFGAKGDGTTSDAWAFAALSAEVNRRGGGTIALRPGRTYIVGAQHRGGDYAWTPEPVIELKQLSKPLRILGNGARLRCAPHLLYGAFDPETGVPVHGEKPTRRVADVASPYRAMISISGCSAPVEVRDIELDGNVGALRIGGQFGDTGWQIPASGLYFEENSAPEAVENVLSHHHAEDGVTIIGTADRPGRSRFSRLICRYNGRQGVSLVAGQAFDFADCEFSRTGRSALYSAPGAGVDIEAERRPIRDLTFTRCKFVDNRGVGLLADSGDSARARFADCLFVGTTTWSAWPYKPDFAFQRCTFVGAVVHPYPSDDASQATRFVNCRFTDDPRLSPNGKVYVGNGPIVNMAVSDHILFDRCAFRMVGDGTLPWSWRAIYRDCTMSQRSPAKGMPKGRYLGHSSIVGIVDLWGAMVEGVLTINGKLAAQGSQGGPPW
jgi:hypothetical protein